MSENGIVMRDAGVIAREINFIKEQTKRQMLAASMEIGARLCEAKELVGHGEWEKWLCENVDYSQSTANNLMRIYREYGSQQINLLTGKAPAEVFAEISYTQAVALMGLPMPERMELAAEKDVAAMSTRELEREVEARRAAETRAETLDAELAAASDEKSALEAEIEAARRDRKDTGSGGCARTGGHERIYPPHRRGQCAYHGGRGGAPRERGRACQSEIRCREGKDTGGQAEGGNGQRGGIRQGRGGKGIFGSASRCRGTRCGA